MKQEVIDSFKNREVKAKNIFIMDEIPKTVAYGFVTKYHYLGDAKFFSKFAYGLFNDGELVGVATYSNPQGRFSLMGWFGFTNENQEVLELSRLCMLPQLNGTNATSYLLGGSIKLLKSKGIRAVITLADSNNHVGSIYQVCNFKYYGLTDTKSDFFHIDGRVNPRGDTKGTQGVWIPRTRKHRYCYLLDKALEVKYIEKSYPKKGDTLILDCCNGTNKVHDKRFDKWYTCPRCIGKISEIKIEYQRIICNGICNNVTANKLLDAIMDKVKVPLIVTNDSMWKAIASEKNITTEPISNDSMLGDIDCILTTIESRKLVSALKTNIQKCICCYDNDVSKYYLFDKKLKYKVELK